VVNTDHCESRASAETSPPQTAGYVLAGGKSERFGRDKAKVRIDGRPMVLRMCELLSDSALSPVLVVAPPEKFREYGVACVADRWPGEGPLGGIITALLQGGTVSPAGGRSVVISCDMPFLSSDWLRYLAKRSMVNEAQVTVARSAHGLEPLCACYRADALPPLRSAFERGVRKVSEAMKTLDMEVLDQTHWKRFDTTGRLFSNMNTPGDYQAAKQLLEAEN
jgi:molybdopterin-guanine dinucleotide biosynthesis protein A